MTSRALALLVAVSTLTPSAALAAPTGQRLTGELLGDPATAWFEASTGDLEVRWRGQTFAGVADGSRRWRPILSFQLEQVLFARGAAGRLDGATPVPKALDLRVGLIGAGASLRGAFILDKTRVTGRLSVPSKPWSTRLNNAWSAAKAWIAGAPSTDPAAQPLGEERPPSAAEAALKLQQAESDASFRAALADYQAANARERAAALTVLTKLQERLARELEHVESNATDVDPETVHHELDRVLSAHAQRSLNVYESLWEGSRAQSFSAQIARLKHLETSRPTATQRALARSARERVTRANDEELALFRRGDYDALKANVLPSLTRR